MISLPCFLNLFIQINLLLLKVLLFMPLFVLDTFSPFIFIFFLFYIIHLYIFNNQLNFQRLLILFCWSRPLFNPRSPTQLPVWQLHLANSHGPKARYVQQCTWGPTLLPRCPALLDGVPSTTVAQARNLRVIFDASLIFSSLIHY